ncbi:hypothetical protein [Pseudomonas amygdali]|uniref:hypothetical protein n=1 Tax=Pseudomonas amygdali TaxID=47877 RepID=UPI0001CC0D35|nr:hypothetical protein [Pseudomonas amygdali]
MKPHREIPEKLSFLKTLKKPSSEGYRKAPWLLNDFSQNIWHVNFEYKEPKEALIYSIFRPGNALEALIYLGATAGFSNKSAAT